MTEELKKLRDKMAEGQAEKAFGEYSELTNEEEINAYLAIVTDFRLGFDACYKEMQAQQDQHLKLFEESIRHSFKEREDSLKAQLDLAVKALEEFIKKDERTWEKFPSSCGIYSVYADEAKKALDEIQKMRGSLQSLKD